MYTRRLELAVDHFGRKDGDDEGHLPLVLGARPDRLPVPLHLAPVADELPLVTAARHLHAEAAGIGTVQGADTGVHGFGLIE